jgi:hypothetical protein
MRNLILNSTMCDADFPNIRISSDPDFAADTMRMKLDGIRNTVK